VHQYGLDQAPTAQMYEPFDQAPFSWVTIVLRTALPAESVAAALRATMHEVDPDQPLSKVLTVDQLVGQTLATRRFSTLLLIGFALSALLLAAVGLYGTIAYTVGQRTREIGVRMALGAQARQVQAAVIRSGRLLESFVYGVSPRDPLTLLVVGALMLVVALLATWLPAWRAARVDPMVALRHE
jgi:ABC-type antimicrobial peptide transport system permease subunit